MNPEEYNTLQRSNIGKENISNSGRDDKSGQYPKPDYWNSNNVNYAAYGSKRNDLAKNVSAEDVELPFDINKSNPSKSPNNRVDETASGHVIELDDTEDNQRILVKHNNGTGVEFRPDGSILLSSTNHKVELVNGESVVIVEGDGQLVYKGNLDLKVTGDLNIDCLNFNLTTKGNKVENINGSVRSNIVGNVTNIITGALSNMVAKAVTNTFLGGSKNNVKGDFVNRVEGSATHTTSGGFLLTSEENIAMSTPDLDMAANSLSVFGKSGYFGGESILYYGQGAKFDEGVTAPTFHGDLDGTATTATVAQSQSYADPDGGGGTGSAGSITDTPTPTIGSMDQTTVNAYLNKSSAGIRKVKVDAGDVIKNAIDKTKEFAGISNKTVTPKVVRSKFRDPANASNESFVSAASGNGALCPSYSQKTPLGIGRTVGVEPTPVTSTDKRDGVVNPANAYVPKRSRKVNLVPEFQFNPYFSGKITHKTKLAPEVRISKFLGTDDPTNLDFIRDTTMRTEIAKYLYLHTQMLVDVNNNTKEFGDITLIVAEGIYRPGPEEVVTPGSINDLKMKGRAVVYSVVDTSNKTNASRLFDVITYLKDNAYYDELILSYDTIDCGNLEARIIVTLPEVSAEWEGTYRRQIRTEYNGSVFAKNEFVEALPYATTQNSDPDVQLELPEDSYPTVKGKADYRADPSGTVWLEPNFVVSTKTHPELYPEAQVNMKSLLENEFALMQQYYGSTIPINDALPWGPVKGLTFGTARKPPSRGGGSQHWYGKAIDVSIKGLSDSQKIKLLEAGLKAGFRGVGLGNTIIHFDLRNTYTAWNYKNHYWAGKPFSYWNTYIEGIRR